MPWFEERVYKDARIEGEWFSLYPLGERQEVITLKRHGHSVTGTITCTKSRTGRDEGQQYDVQGSFRNMILPLTYEAHDRSKTDRGTITLKLIDNAARFDGKIAAYGDEGDLILSTDVIWFRSRKGLEQHVADLQSEKAAREEYRKRTKEAEEAREKLKKETTPKNSEQLAQLPAADQSKGDEKGERVSRTERDEGQVEADGEVAPRARDS